MMTLKFSRNAIVTRASTDRRPVRPAADDNFEIKPATLLKNRPWHRCFPVNFANVLKTSFPT